MLLLGKPAYAVLIAILTVLIFIMHRENIARLLKGEEPRIGARKAAAAE
jgi:glycerol-3-phosphate acyltransferase PlsY